MNDKLALQRKILTAIDDPEKLAAIAEREGIDPELWRYWQDVWQIVEALKETP